MEAAYMIRSGNRQSLLTRGWYVASEVEIAFMGLSGGAHDLLIILKHFQGENDDSWPTQEYLAQILKTSVRTIQRRLAELAAKGALVCQRTGRSSHYSVCYGHATASEIRVLLGGEVAIPADLVVTGTPQRDASDATHPDAPLPYKEPPIKNHNNTPSLREGDDASPQQEDEMQHQQMALDDLDPVEGLHLRDSQELPDGPAQRSGIWWPDNHSAPAPTGRQRPARTQAQQDAPMALAIDFDRLIRQADWHAGPAPVNRSGLARNLSAWKRDGLSPDRIRAMMHRYVADASMRSSGKAPWVDFVGKRHKLLAAAARADEARTVEAHRHDDEAYWLGSMAQ